MKTVHLIYPRTIGTIAPEIYGHFSEHIGGVFYDGLWVGRDSAIPNIRGFRANLVEKLRVLRPPVLRWPGGCFAETYNWRDGIGEDRPVRRNWWTRLDGRMESNAVGTHEFMDLCELIGAKAYFAANLTGMTPMDIRDWMDYCLSPRGSTTLALEREKNGHPEPFDIPFWGVGNENWGGGGNMRPEYYADEFRRYATLMRNIREDAQFYACGTDGMDYSWTHGVMRNLSTTRCKADGFAMHYYCGTAGEAAEFTPEQWDQQLCQAQKMEDIILRNWAIISAYGMEKTCPLIVDEWGCWHKDGSGPSKGYNLFEQQSTMRDAMVAALTLNIFNRHCDKVRMANVAQLVNNLHCLFLAGGENCITTPTYHVFDLYKDHQGARSIETLVTENESFSDSLSVSASVKDGRTLITVGNLSCSADSVFTLKATGLALPETAEGKLLCSADIRDHNTFETPEKVKPVRLTLDLNKPITIPKAGILAIAF